MAEGGVEWEVYKENLLPPGEGWGATAPNPDLSHQEARRAALKQRQAFESELCMCTGDDPLDVWDRYIRWTVQTYPQGGKESNLTVLLERAVQLFVDDERYSDDPRYIDIWIKLAQNSTVPENSYSYMQAQGIGVTRAAFYISWSEEYEKHGDYQKADAILLNGLKSGAQPVDKLRQYHKGLQDRASRHAMGGGAKGAQEEETPPRCLVDLRPRRGKRSGAPMNRGQSGGLDMQDTHNNQNAPMAIFDENQIGCSSVEAPPSMIQHHIEGDQMPSMPASQMDKEAQVQSTLEHQPKEQMQVAGGAKEQSMYCKELINSGVIEFSFEELRAQRYYKRMRQGLDEKLDHLTKEEEDLKQKIEEKQRDLQLRKSQQAQQPQVGQDVSTREEDIITPVAEPGSGLGSSAQQPFQIFVDSPCGAAHSSGNSNPCQNADPSDDVFYPLGESAMSIRIQYPTKGKGPLNEHVQMSKNFRERTECLTDESAIVYDHKNKTLCASPNDTNDFALANKMASTPYTGTLGHRISLPNTGSLTKDIRDMTGNVPVVVTPHPEVDSGKKLSPIQEAALEASMVSSIASASSLGVLSVGKTRTHLSRLEESQADMEIMNQTSSNMHSPPKDPCSLNTSIQPLKQLDLRDFPNYHSEPGCLPLVEEDDVLFLGNETFFVSSKMEERDNLTIYSGQCGEEVILKVERSTVPQDLYISQLMERLTREPQLPASDSGRHFLFQDGCITVHKASALQWSQDGCLEQLFLTLETKLLCMSLLGCLDMKMAHTLPSGSQSPSYQCLG